MKAPSSGHEVLKNATCPTPGKARPSHEEVVHDDESGCNEDRSPVTSIPISLITNICWVWFSVWPASLLCRNFNCRAKSVGCPNTPSTSLYYISLYLGWEIYDQHTNTNMNDKDHLVRQLTTIPPARVLGSHICSNFYWHTHLHRVNKSLFKSPLT